MGNHHNHDHSHHHLVEGKNLLFSIVLNLVITTAQVIGGLISGSLAILSDALHNFSDVLSLVFSYVAHKLAKKKASVNQTFGYKRAEFCQCNDFNYCGFLFNLWSHRTIYQSSSY